MPHSKLIEARHAQGLNAYHTGASIKDVIRTLDEIMAMHDKPDLTHDEHKEISDAGPSFIAGFADGALEDFRMIVAQRRGQRA